MDPTQAVEATATPTPERAPYTLWQLVRYFLRLGTLGFGGPVALGTFLPCYVFVVIAAPAFRKYGKRPTIAAFVKGVTAAAIGAITGAVIILGRRTIIDIPTVLIALVTLTLLWRREKIPQPVIFVV